MSILEDAINKYGGSDIAYRNKLKETVRNQLGYSNYMSKLKAQTGAPADIGDISGLSPAGINARISSRFGSQNENVSTMGDIVGAVDTAAGTIADKRIADAKAADAAAAQKYGINNGVMFNPNGQLDTQINEYMKNPYNPDGSVKSLQQFEAEMNDYYSNPQNMETSAKMVDANGNPTSYQVHTPEDIKSMIDKRVPKDFIGNEQMYAAMAMGYSKKQAKDPSTSGAVRDAMQMTTKEVVDPATGNKVIETLPKFTTEDLQNKYPDLTDIEVKGIMKPVEQKSMVDDIRKDPLLQDRQALSTLMQEGGGYQAVMKDPKYIELKTNLGFEYPNFTAAEIDALIYNVIRSV